MILKDFDNYFLAKDEPVKACLLALKAIILSLDKDVSTAWKYRMPFFCYKGKMFCYLWTDKKTKEPYIGVVEGKRLNHPFLEQGERARMKIMRVNSTEDIPLEDIVSVLQEALDLYRNGIVKIQT